MVWVGGSQGTLAPSLVDLFLEADRLFPGRSKASDGSLGDQAHATRDSDHNPKEPNPPGWVDAGDLTDDKAHGCDADLLAHHLVASRDPRVKYLIWNSTIVRSYAKPGLPAWTPEPYTGSNPHDKHTHISVTEAGRHIRGPWFPSAQPAPPPPPEEDDMPKVYDITDPHPDKAASWLVVGNVRYQIPNPSYREAAVAVWGEEYVSAAAWDLLRSATSLGITPLIDLERLSDEDVERIAEASADEQARRLGG